MGSFKKSNTHTFAKLFATLLASLYYTSLVRSSPTTIAPDQLHKRQVTPVANESRSDPQQITGGFTLPATVLTPQSENTSGPLSGAAQLSAPSNSSEPTAALRTAPSLPAPTIASTDPSGPFHASTFSLPDRPTSSATPGLTVPATAAAGSIPQVKPGSTVPRPASIPAVVPGSNFPSEAQRDAQSPIATQPPHKKNNAPPVPAPQPPTDPASQSTQVKSDSPVRSGLPVLPAAASVASPLASSGLASVAEQSPQENLSLPVAQSVPAQAEPKSPVPVRPGAATAVQSSQAATSGSSPATRVNSTLPSSSDQVEKFKPPVLNENQLVSPLNASQRAAFLNPGSGSVPQSFEMEPNSSAKSAPAPALLTSTNHSTASTAAQGNPKSNSAPLATPYVPSSGPAFQSNGTTPGSSITPLAFTADQPTPQSHFAPLPTTLEPASGPAPQFPAVKPGLPVTLPAPTAGRPTPQSSVVSPILPASSGENQTFEATPGTSVKPQFSNGNQPPSPSNTSQAATFFKPAGGPVPQSTEMAPNSSANSAPALDLVTSIRNSTATSVAGASPQSNSSPIAIPSTPNNGDAFKFNGTTPGSSATTPTFTGGQSSPQSIYVPSATPLKTANVLASASNNTTVGPSVKPLALEAGQATPQSNSSLSATTLEPANGPALQSTQVRPNSSATSAPPPPSLLSNSTASPAGKQATQSNSVPLVLPPAPVNGTVSSSTTATLGSSVTPPTSPPKPPVNSASSPNVVVSTSSQGSSGSTPVSTPKNHSSNFPSDSPPSQLSPPLDLHQTSPGKEGRKHATFTGLPPAPGQESAGSFSALPPAPGQETVSDEFTALPSAPGQSVSTETSQETPSSKSFALPAAPGQNQPDLSDAEDSTGHFAGFAPAPGQSESSDDGSLPVTTNDTSSNLLGNVKLPISNETWIQLKIDDILVQQNTTIYEYARMNKGGNFICGIGENCNSGQPFYPVQSPAWQVLYAAQEYNHFMNAMFDSVKYTLSMLHSTSASMTNDLFQDITDSRLVLDLKWVFTDLYRGITYGAVAALFIVWFSFLPGTIFVLLGTALGAGIAAWIQGTPKTVTYESWSQLSFYIAESQDRILSSISKAYSESLAAPINSDIGLGKALKGGTFFQPSTTNGIMETMEKHTKRIFQARLLSRMLRQNNAFVTIGESECNGPGPGGAWGGNDVISYCDREAKLMYNVIRAHKKKSLNTIYGASAIINKYGFSAEYITTTSWKCQKKYGGFEHDVGIDIVGKIPTELNDDCAINLPVCDTRIQDVRELRQGKHKTTVVACRQGAGLPI